VTAPEIVRRFNNSSIQCAWILISVIGGGSFRFAGDRLVIGTTFDSLSILVSAIPEAMIEAYVAGAIGS
jgi:hypothetical protein